MDIVGGYRDGEPEEPAGSQEVNAARDAFVVGRDIIFFTGAIPGMGQQVPGLGELLFTARAHGHRGRLSVAFGAGGTLVVTDQRATVWRWSLATGAALPGRAGPASFSSGTSCGSASARGWPSAPLKRRSPSRTAGT